VSKLIPAVAVAAALCAAGCNGPEADPVPLVEGVVVGKRDADPSQVRAGAREVEIPATLKLRVRPDDGGPDFEVSVDPGRYDSAAPGDRVRVFRPTVTEPARRRVTP